MINKRNPFKGKNAKQTLHKNMRCNINLIGMAGSCATHFILFLKGLIEKNPENRFSAEQALAHNIFQREIYNEGESNILSTKFERILPQRRIPQGKAHHDELHAYKNFEDKFKNSKNLQNATSRNIGSHRVNSRGEIQQDDFANEDIGKSNFIFDLGEDQAKNFPHPRPPKSHKNVSKISHNTQISRKLTLRGDKSIISSKNYNNSKSTIRDEANVNFSSNSSKISQGLAKLTSFDEKTLIKEYLNRYKEL
jgi:serine/threonine protein kinase